MRLTIRALLAVAALVAIPVSVQAAETIEVLCPAEARGSVSHTGASDWIATPQSSRVMNVTLDQIGGQPALICNYAMFAASYIIWQRPPVSHPNCLANPARMGFDCRNT